MAGLTADEAFIDYTFIHFTALERRAGRGMVAGAVRPLGVDLSELPRIVEPWQVVGEVTPAPPAISAWRPARAIAAGCGDTAAGALGAGIVEPGMLFDTAGTAAVLAGCTDQFVADREHRALLTHALGHPGPLATRWPTSPAAGSRCAGSAISSTRAARRRAPGAICTTR